MTQIMQAAGQAKTMMDTAAYQWVATFIRPESATISPDGLVDQAEMLLRREGARSVRSHWLEEGRICQMSYLSAEGAASAALHDWAVTQEIDCLSVPASNAGIQLLICDMDSTMIAQECIDEIAAAIDEDATLVAELLAHHPEGPQSIRERVSAITEQAMRGELQFEESLIARVALLKGLPEAALQQIFDERVSMMPGAKALVQAMKDAGAHTILVSGGFTFFASRVAAALGFDEFHANTLEIEDGVLTGRVVMPILGQNAKLEILQRYCAAHGVDASAVLAIGDGANDLAMLEYVQHEQGMAVAYHAKPIVQDRILNRLNYADHSALIATQRVAA